MAVLIVVNGADHPDEDAWVIECASIEAERNGIALPPYRGTAVGLHDQPLHMYCDLNEVAEQARATYAGMKESRDAVRSGG